MLAGHYATALVAEQRAPRGTLLWYLGVSQLPDLLWLVFHYLGLEPTRPVNVFEATLETISVDMLFSHDVLPILGWAVLFGGLGAFLFKDRRVGVATVVLIGLHALTDYLGGYPHHVFGPESPAVGTGLYLTMPFLAVAGEAAYSAVFVGWFLREERRSGVARSAGSLWAIIGLFVFNVAFMASIAVTSMGERFGLPAFETPFNTTIPTLVVSYLGMGAILWVAVRRGRSTTA